MVENLHSAEMAAESEGGRYEFDKWTPHGSSEVPAAIRSECNKFIDIAEKIINGTINQKKGIDASAVRVSISQPGNTRFVELSVAVENLKLLAKEVYRLYTLSDAVFNTSFKGEVVSQKVKSNEVETEATNVLSTVHLVFDQLKQYYDMPE